MNVKIYTMTHKQFDEPSDLMYVPLQVGCEGKKSLGYVCDNTGDNISNKNCYYSELTGVYWAWKNVHDVDYIGICHYRRYLLNKKNVMLTESEILDILKESDVIVTKKLDLNFSYHYGFSENHNIDDLDETGRVINELYPEYWEDYNLLVNEKHTYFGNICIMSKKDYDSYCEWLFNIFFHVEPRVNLDNYDSYHKRVFGFISEFLLYLWIYHNKKKTYECKVGMTGEKVEIREIKEMLSDYFKNRDIEGARTYFRDYLNRRPDILMEASDINGDLKVAMQMISTAEYETSKYGHCYIDSNNNFKLLLRIFKLINSVVVRYVNETATEADAALLKDFKPSAVMLRIATMIFCKDKDKHDRIIIAINNDIV